MIIKKGKHLAAFYRNGIKKISCILAAVSISFFASAGTQLSFIEIAQACFQGDNQCSSCSPDGPDASPYPDLNASQSGVLFLVGASSPVSIEQNATTSTHEITFPGATVTNVNFTRVGGDSTVSDPTPTITSKYTANDTARIFITGMTASDILTYDVGITFTAPSAGGVMTVENYLDTDDPTTVTSYFPIDILAPNATPVINPNSVTSDHSNSGTKNFDIAVSATDPDGGDTVTLSLSSCSGQWSLQSNSPGNPATATARFVANQDQSGIFTCTVQATDDGAPTASANAVMTAFVEDGAATLTLTPSDLSNILNGGTQVVNVEFDDGDDTSQSDTISITSSSPDVEVFEDDLTTAFTSLLVNYDGSGLADFDFYITTALDYKGGEFITISGKDFNINYNIGPASTGAGRRRQTSDSSAADITKTGEGLLVVDDEKQKCWKTAVQVIGNEGAQLFLPLAPESVKAPRDYTPTGSQSQLDSIQIQAALDLYSKYNIPLHSSLSFLSQKNSAPVEDESFGYSLYYNDFIQDKYGLSLSQKYVQSYEEGQQSGSSVFDYGTAGYDEQLQWDLGLGLRYTDDFKFSGDFAQSDTPDEFSDYSSFLSVGFKESSNLKVDLSASFDYLGSTDTDVTEEYSTTIGEIGNYMKWTKGLDLRADFDYSNVEFESSVPQGRTGIYSEHSLNF